MDKEMNTSHAKNQLETVEAMLVRIGLKLDRLFAANSTVSADRAIDENEFGSQCPIGGSPMNEPTAGSNGGLESRRVALLTRHFFLIDARLQAAERTLALMTLAIAALLNRQSHRLAGEPPATERRGRLGFLELNRIAR